MLLWAMQLLVYYAQPPICVFLRTQYKRTSAAKDTAHKHQHTHHGTTTYPNSGEHIKVTMSLEVVPHLWALQDIGVAPAAAQTCMALLAAPGGLYLDVKSAYSSAEQCMLFVGALSGMGVNAKVGWLQWALWRVQGPLLRVQVLGGSVHGCIE